MLGLGICAMPTRDGRWKVRMYIGAERINLGYFDSLDEASRCVHAVGRLLGLV